MTSLPDTSIHPRRVLLASHVLVWLMIVAVLWLRLLPAAAAGLLVYSLTRMIEARLLAQRSLSHWARMLSIAVVIFFVCLVIAGIGLVIVRLIERNQGFSGMLLKSAEIVADLRNMLPATMGELLPQSTSEVRDTAAEWLRKHGSRISTLGYGGVRGLTLTLIGLICGAMVAWSDPVGPAFYRPLSARLLERLALLSGAFRAVVFAQVRISALNTLLTALYLLGLLPLLGIHMPYGKSLVVLTFIVGLLPVLGNLISNTFIVLISLSVSMGLAVGSLGFLVFIHKLEYFVNARIIGGRIEARAWELIMSMILMEALFGVSGVIAAPVVYAYLKRELSRAGLIGPNTASAAPGP